MHYALGWQTWQGGRKKAWQSCQTILVRLEQIELGKKCSAELAAFRTAVATYRQRYGVS